MASPVAFTPIVRYFDYKHLPENLHEIGRDMLVMAKSMDQRLPDCAEKSAGLRKLLEAKDCFVRAALP